MSRNTQTPPSAGLVRVYLSLLALLAASALTVLLPPAPWKTVWSLAVAGAMAGLIAWRFMRLGEHRGLTRVFAAAGLFWFGLLVVLALSDYLSRGR